MIARRLANVDAVRARTADELVRDLARELGGILPDDGASS